MVGKTTRDKKKHFKYHIFRKKIAYKYLRKFTILCFNLTAFLLLSLFNQGRINHMAEAAYATGPAVCPFLGARAFSKIKKKPAKRQKRGLSNIFCDMEDFRSYNATYTDIQQTMQPYETNICSGRYHMKIMT